MLTFQRFTGIVICLLIAAGMSMTGCSAVEGTGADDRNSAIVSQRRLASPESRIPTADVRQPTEAEAPAPEPEEDRSPPDSTAAKSKGAKDDEGWNSLPPSTVPDVIEAPRPKLRGDIRGVYVSGNALRGSRWKRMESILENTEINALVIDVKNDNGRLTYPSQVDIAKQIGADSAAKLQDLSSFLKPLKQKNTYLIARIVTFKDPYLAAKKPEWAIHKKDGTIWRDKRGVSWIDPYNEQVWEYTVAVAEEAVQSGFDEVQFDYVRFPEQVKTLEREAAFRNFRNETKDQIIQRFLKTAAQRIHRAGGAVSADVFGLTTTAKDGMGIGQKWELLTQTVDAISPMIYPSHYAAGSYGIKAPDLQPYRIVKAAAGDAKARNEAMRVNGEPTAAVRPWLQDFTATWIHPHQTYKDQQIQEQIRALKEHGIHQYLLWNPASKYSL